MLRRQNSAHIYRPSSNQANPPPTLTTTPSLLNNLNNILFAQSAPFSQVNNNGYGSNQPSSVLEKLLCPPSRKHSTTKPHVNFKVDVEQLQKERNSLKIQNSKLDKIIISLKLELAAKENQIKELRQSSYTKDKCPAGTAVTVVMQRKKLAEMKLKMLQKDAQIDRLRHIPQNNILKEMEIEKQELLEQTIRLKAVLAARNNIQEQSVSRSDFDAQNEISEEVLRLLKQENEKLKSMLRIADYEKSILKAKKSSIKRISAQYKADCEALRKTLKEKQIDLLKLTEENKTLLFKRVNHMRNENRENEEMYKLRQTLEAAQASARALQQENAVLNEQIKTLQEREKIRTQVNTDLQEKYQSQIRSLVEQLESVQEEYKNFRENYSFKSLLTVSQNNTFMNNKGQVSYPRSCIREEEQEDDDFVEFRMLDKDSFGLSGSTPTGRKSKCVKPFAVRFEMEYLKIIFRKLAIHIQSFFQQNRYSIAQLISIFVNKPFQLSLGSATLVARYFIEDNTSEFVVYDESRTQSRKIIISIAHTSLASPPGQDQETAMDSWLKLLSNCKESITHKILEVMKTEEYIRAADLQKLFEEVFVCPSPKDINYLETQLVSQEYLQTGGFSLHALLNFLKRVFARETSNNSTLKQPPLLINQP